MQQILVTGAGKIGALISLLLAGSGDYRVTLVDLDFAGADHKRLQGQDNIQLQQLDINDHAACSGLLKANSFTAVISSLPFFCNVKVAELAREFGLHYFDLTEDTNVTSQVRQIARGATTAFVPQCGLAPGFISIAANNLMQSFAEIDAVKMRVGALPVNSSNALQYSLTWSTDGVINEYGNLCHGIENGDDVVLQPLQGLEEIQIDGTLYEAFNTSGGLGSLVELYSGKVKSMGYKTIRYPGHCEKIKLLMNDLKLNQDRKTFKRILENSIPKTYQDVVIVYVSVSGMKKGGLIEENYTKKIYPVEIAGHTWSAIQITTASGITTVVDLILQEPEKYQGFIFQEQINLTDFLENRFGHYYA